MNKTESKNSDTPIRPADDSVAANKKPYQAPQILSSEKLEAAAVSCSPDTPGGAGKNTDGLGSCSMMGS